MTVFGQSRVIDDFSVSISDQNGVRITSSRLTISITKICRLFMLAADYVSLTMMSQVELKLPQSTGQFELLHRSVLVFADLILFLHRVRLSQSCSVTCS